MNIRIIGIIFIFSILLLLTFQAIWLSHTYSLERDRIQANLNLCFIESTKKELLLRLKDMDESNRNISIDTSGEKPNYNDPQTTVIEVDIEDGLDDVMPQYLLSHLGISISLPILDSLFQQQLSNAKYKLDYLICYNDSTDIVLESVGNPTLRDKARVFTSDSIPIANKNYVHFLADISVPVVLKQMIGLTIASFLMLLILLIALTLQIRYTYNQYKLNQLREDFSQALIHDLKSPLNTIFIALSNFKNRIFEKNPEFAEKSTEVALEQVLNIQTLVDRILTIARLEDRKMEVVREEIDLPLIIKKLIERYNLSNRKKITFNLTYKLNDTPIYVDKTLVEQAISNLLDNAVKYSGEEVTVSVYCEVKESKLYIRIKDNGFGISLSDQERIFNKFERGAAIYRRGAKGFGLGLNYVKQVALAHRGTVAVSSIKGEGCEFVILIPLLVTSLDKHIEPEIS